MFSPLLDVATLLQVHQKLAQTAAQRMRAILWAAGHPKTHIPGAAGDDQASGGQWLHTRCACQWLHRIEWPMVASPSFACCCSNCGSLICSKASSWGAKSPSSWPACCTLGSCLIAAVLAFGLSDCFHVQSACSAACHAPGDIWSAPDLYKSKQQLVFKLQQGERLLQMQADRIHSEQPCRQFVTALLACGCQPMPCGPPAAHKFAVKSPL